MRLFLALELSEHALRGIGELTERAASATAGWSWVRPPSLHLTLRFLGEVEPPADAAARAAWAAAAGSIPDFPIRIGGGGGFPLAGRPRVLWLAVSDPTGRLAALHRAVEAAAVAAGFEPESRVFRPHLTLARARRGRAATRPDPGLLDGSWEQTATRVVLVRSRLGPTGPRYTALATFPLGGEAPGPVGNE